MLDHCRPKVGRVSICPGDPYFAADLSLQSAQLFICRLPQRPTARCIIQRNRDILTQVRLGCLGSAMIGKPEELLSHIFVKRTNGFKRQLPRPGDYDFPIPHHGVFVAVISEVWPCMFGNLAGALAVASSRGGNLREAWISVRSLRPSHR